jgi:hypothetical protein
MGTEVLLKIQVLPHYILLAFYGIRAKMRRIEMIMKQIKYTAYQEILEAK